MRGLHVHVVARLFARVLLLGVIVAFTLLATATSASAQDSPSPTRVRAAVAGSEPFVVHDGAALDGVSVEIFREITRSSNLDVEFVPMASVSAALDAVANREVDVAIGPISITAERAERTRFTQPYYQSSLGILAPRSAGWTDRLSGFLSRAFLVGLAILLFVLLFVGTLVWIAERRANAQQFPREPAAGIANGVWFALVTMTTVGYGDRVPTTTAGRVIASVWMVIALLTASSLTAGIATAITILQLAPPRIASVEQLADRRVAVVRGTTAVPFAQRSRARISLVGGVEEGAERLARGDVDAFVFDRPALRYYLQQNPEVDLVVSEARYAPQAYGFAVADADLQHTLNVALLRASENGRIERIAAGRLGREVERVP